MKKIIMKNIMFIIVAFVILLLKNDMIYASSALGLNMGESYNIVAGISDYSEMVSYSIDDNLVLSMDSNGVITGLQPGSTFISITYLDSSNTIHEYTTEVDIYFVNGIYRIKNVQTGKYLTLSNFKTKKDVSVMFSESADPVLESDTYLTQLWSIECDETFTYFSIKPYYDKNVILDYDQHKERIKTYRLPEFMEYEANDNSTWLIDSGIIETSQELASNRTKLNEFNVYGSGTTNDEWILESATVIPNGVRLVDEHYENSAIIQPRYISQGSKKSLNDLKIRVLSYYRNESSMGVTWSSSDSSIATVYSDGSVRGNRAGSVTITATYYPGATPYTASYTLNVMPYKDGIYEITNLLGARKLLPKHINVTGLAGHFLQADTSVDNKNLWCLQSMIDGTYRISIANNGNDEIDYWVSRDFDTDCVELLNYVEYMDNLSTWTISEAELGSIISYKGDEDYSWRLLESGFEIVDLATPDYDSNESMWTLEELAAPTPTIYIHPYYDSQFLANFDNNRDTALAALYEYLNYAKDIFEAKLEINVVINEPIELVLPESEIEKLNVEGVVNEGGVNDEYIFKNYFNNLVNQLKGDDEEHLNTNKYIIYQAYPFVTSQGVRYVPRSYNQYDRSYIYCTDGNDRNKYATLHELSHTLGGVDHYHNNNGEDGSCTVGNRCTECGTFMDKRTPFCAINYDYYDESEPFCNECLIEMKAGIYFKCYPKTEEE